MLTLHLSNPEATAVAVRDGRILGAGSLEECRSWGDAVVDDTFADAVLVPGFVEAHGHAFDGMMGLLPWVGYDDRPLPDGGSAPGVRSYDELVERLRAAAASLAAGEPLIATGFDPIFFPGEGRLGRDQLDRVSGERPVFVMHASGHLASVNSALLAAEGITADVATPGVARDGRGEPTGELQEAPAMSLAGGAFRAFRRLSTDPRVLRNHGQLCRNAGVTTSTELTGPLLLAPHLAEEWHAVVDDPDFPARMMLLNLPFAPGGGGDPEAAAEATLALRARDTDKLRNLGAKVVADGSIQGWTAMLSWPGYFRGEDNGMLLVAPEELVAVVRAFHSRRLPVHCHCNGDGAAGMFLDAVETVLAADAWLDHRHCLQHSQTTTPAQYRRMARLGVTANVFTNHVWYWGDQHHEQTMGPDRTRGMWACRTALDAGVSLSLHTDSGVTPIGHLSTMWCAVNRVSRSGRVLGTHERITPAEALHAATLGAAYQLHLDHEIGSIEPGKRADLTALDASPLDVDPMAIRDLRVLGTVLGGVAFPVS